MPRDIGTGLYHYPDGTPGNPGQTVFSARYNTFINDLSNTLNQALPINMGGTGGTDGATARDNLDAEVAAAQVTNYNSHVFENGSFFSVNDTTGAPAAGTAFAGICYKFNDSYIVLEARNVSTEPGKLYIRQKVAGVWGAWSASTTTYAPLVVIADPTTTNASLVLVKTVDTQNNNVLGYLNTTARWALILGNSVPETGGNVGSDFTVNRYSDAGAFLDTPLRIERATGGIISNKTNPVISLRKTASGQNNSLTGYLNTLPRWSVALGNSTAETGINVGSDFSVVRYDDLGAVMDVPLLIDRAHGTIISNRAHPEVSLRKTVADQNNNLTGCLNALPRWNIILGDSTAESGSNVGSDFSINRYNDAGTFVNAPLQITRSTGAVTMNAPAMVLPSAAFVPDAFASVRIGYSVSGMPYGILLRTATTGTSYPIVFSNSVNATVGNISHTDTVTSYNTASDERLKDDAKPFDRARSILDALKIWDFRWKETGTRAIGVFAQDAIDAFADAITPPDNKNDVWMVDYSKFVPLLISDAQETHARLATLETQLQEAMTRIEALEAAQATP